MSRRSSLAALVVALAVVVSACDWAQPRFGPERTGHNGGERAIGPSEVIDLEQRWSARLTPASDDVSPIVAGGRVFAVANGQSSGSSTLTAFDAGSGVQLWSRTFAGTGDPGMFSPGVSITTAGDTLIVGRVFGTSPGELLALDAATGAVRWTDQVGWGIVEPVVRDGVIYAGYVRLDGSATTGVAAFDLATGALLWHSEAYTVARGLVAVAGDRAYVSAGTELQVFDAAGAEGCWDDLGGMRRCTPLWTGPLGSGTSHMPAVAGSEVVVSSSDGLVRAFPRAGCGAATCDPTWTGDAGAAVHGDPAVADGRIFVGTDNEDLVAFPVGGCAVSPCAPTWRGITGERTRGTPSVANGVVYVAANDGLLYAFPSRCPGTSCSSLRTLEIGGRPYGAPAIAHGTLYAGADGTLRAWSLPPDPT